MYCLIKRDDCSYQLNNMEMTQEEKAKAYDEAIKKAKEIVKYYKTHNRSDEASIEDLETIFQELKESENERIKREILELVSISRNGNQFEEIKDWLEKKTIIIPKFRVGDEIKTANEDSLTVTKIDEEGYWSEDLFICDFDEECKWDFANEQKPVEGSEKDDERIRKGIKSILEHYKESGEVVCPYPFVSIDETLTWLEKQSEKKFVEPYNNEVKLLFIKALERVEELNAKDYKLTDCDKNCWWEDFKAYSEQIFANSTKTCKNKQESTIPKWKYKKGLIQLSKDSIAINKYGRVVKVSSGAFVNDAWILDYDELVKLPKEELNL